MRHALPILLLLTGACVVPADRVADAVAEPSAEATETTCDPDWSVWLDTASANPGAVLLGSVYAEGDLDLTQIVSAHIAGAADVLAIDRRVPGQAVLTIAVPTDAVPGAADLELLLQDGRTLVLTNALHIGTQAVAPTFLTSGC